MSKPKPGVCGICGRAVVQPLKPIPGWCYPLGYQSTDWKCPDFGHFYEANLDLVKVRCSDCAKW